MRKPRRDKVAPFAKYDGLIYSYRVTCVLNNGRELIFVDEKPFDLTQSVDKKVVVKLATSFISENKECNDLLEEEIKYSDLFNEYLFVNEYYLFLKRQLNFQILNSM